MEFDSLDSFQSWAKSNIGNPFVVQFESHDSAVIAVDVGGELQGFSFRLYPAIGSLVIRLWSGKCYAVVDQNFLSFIESLILNYPGILRTTPYSLPDEFLSLFGFSEVIELYAVKGQHFGDLDNLDLESIGFTKLVDLVAVCDDAVISADQKFGNMVVGESPGRFVECDDGVVQFFCVPGSEHLLGLSGAELVTVFNAFGKPVENKTE